MAYPISQYIIFPFIRRLITSVKGLNYIPKKTPFIVVANHISQTDPLFIITSLFHIHKQKIHYISVYRNLGEFFRKKISEQWAGCILLDQQNRAKAVTDSVERLKHSDIVGIFPEGVRNPDANVISRGHTGMIRIALQAKVPIVPIGIITKGEKHRLRKDGRHISDWRDAVKQYIFKHEPFHINIGEPILLNKYYNTPITHKLLRSLTDNIMESLSKLSNRPYDPEYRPEHLFKEKLSSQSS